LALVSLLAITQAAVAQEGIHIKSDGTVSFLWTTTDSVGGKWDINSNGTVNDGVNDTYDGGMNLIVGGSNFNFSGQGKINKQRNEVEIGPWNWNNVKVYRRVYVDKKGGYCRWIDIFENPSKSEQTLAIRYYSNMGGQTSSMLTTTGKASVTPKDWGVVTLCQNSGSRSQVVHFFATKNSKIKPSWQHKSGDNIYYNLNLKVPAGKTVSLCFFEAQRNGHDNAKKFLKDFDIHKALAQIPPPLRQTIVNMAGATLILGNLELPRNAKYDKAVLRNGDELLGQILNTEFSIETSFGLLNLPASRVIGLSVPAADDPYTHMGLTDGQVVAGKLTSGPIKLKLTSGGQMDLTLTKLRTAAFKLSPAKPMEIKIARPTIILRNGQQLFFTGSDVDGMYRCEHGDIQLKHKNLSRIYLDTPDGGLHRVVFRNGSVLSGLLAADQMEFNLDLKLKLKTRRHLISQFAFPSKVVSTKGMATMNFRNEDSLTGKVLDESLTLRTGSGDITLKPDQISLISFAPVPVGKVRIKLHKGTNLSGRLMSEYINLQITPGPAVKVFAGHLRELHIPQPPSATTGGNETTDKPKPKPGSLEEAKAKLKELTRRQAVLEKAMAEVQVTKDSSPTQKKKLLNLRQEFAQTVVLIDTTSKRIAELQARQDAEKQKDAEKEKEEAIRRAAEKVIKLEIRN